MHRDDVSDSIHRCAASPVAERGRICGRSVNGHTATSPRRSSTRSSRRSSSSTRRRGLIVDVNRGAASCSGAIATSSSGGGSLSSLPPAEAKRLAAIVAPIAAGDRDLATVMMPYRLPSGATISVEVVLQPIDLRDRRPEHRRHRPRHHRPDRGPGPPPAPGPGRARPGSRAERRHPGDGRGGRGLRARTAGSSLSNPAAEQTLPGHRGADLRRHPRPARRPDGRPQARRAGRPDRARRSRADPDRWIELATYPVNVGIGLATAGEETILVMRDVTDRPPARSHPRDVHRRAVARAADPGHDDLRWREAPRPRALDARRGDPSRDLPRHLRRGRAAPAPGRGRRRAEPVRRRGRRDRLGAGPPPAVCCPRRRPLRGGALAGGHLRPRRGAPGCRRCSPTRPTSSRSSATCCRTRRSTAAPGSTVTLAASTGRRRGHRPRLDDGPGFPAEETSRLFELFYRAPGTAAIGQRRRHRPVRVRPPRAAMGGRIWATPRTEGGAEFGFALTPRRVAGLPSGGRPRCRA